MESEGIVFAHFLGGIKVRVFCERNVRKKKGQFVSLKTNVENESDRKDEKPSNIRVRVKKHSFSSSKDPVALNIIFFNFRGQQQVQRNSIVKISFTNLFFFFSSRAGIILTDILLLIHN